VKSKVIAFGELLWDILPGGRVLGGAPANFIFRINQLGHEGKLVTRLGVDKLGKEALGEVKNLGLDCSLIQLDEKHPTGTVNVCLDENGKPDFEIKSGVAYDYISLNGSISDEVVNSDCICYGTLIQRSEVSGSTLYSLLEGAKNSLKFCDINLRKECYTEETVNSSLELADILKLNDEELVLLGRMIGIKGSEIRDIAEGILDKFKLRIVLVTLGEQGAFCVSKEGEFTYTPGYKVEVIDTVGSGDAFSAGFMHVILMGGNIREALNFGNAIGAINAGKPGATVPISEKEVFDFITRHQS